MTTQKEIKETIDSNFNYFFNDNERGGSSRWLVSPDTVKLCVIGIVERMIEKERDEFIAKVEGLIGEDMKCKNDGQDYTHGIEDGYNQAKQEMRDKLKTLKHHDK